jgi:hypothetical protein
MYMYTVIGVREQETPDGDLNRPAALCLFLSGNNGLEYSCTKYSMRLGILNILLLKSKVYYCSVHAYFPD